MEIIIHRVNTIKKLKELPKTFGAEIDIRSSGSKLILNHDPYQSGENFINFISEYNKGTLILNVKESGIENDVLKIVESSGIKSYFLLDVEFPFIFKSIKKKKNIAIRFSEWESIQTAKLMIKKFDWLWIDTVSKLPITKHNLNIIKKFKSCVVCPERWGRPKQIDLYKKKLNNLKFKPTAVMTSINYSKKWLQFDSSSY